MAIVALLDSDEPLPLQVSWALWFASAKQAPLTILWPESPESKSPELIGAQVESLVAEADGFVFVGGRAHGEQEEGDAVEPDDPEDSRRECRLVVVDLGANGAVHSAILEASAEMFVVLLKKVDSAVPRVAEIGREVLPRVACSVAVVQLGEERWPIQHLMVAASRGAHARAAVKLSSQLIRSVGGRLTGAYVEPDIGGDAQSVGRHLLDKVLHAALLDDAKDVDRRVVIGANVESGLHKASEVVEPDAVVLGMPRPGLLGPRFFGLTPARLCRKAAVPVVILREAMPLGNRLRRFFEDVLQRCVPQVERSTRVELAARVQSNSAWNFDFVALISLSTVIAALGLLQDSAAVIIGAMLIAPLMTPILGVGLALSQGNAVLTRLAFRSIFFGVGTSFLLAVLVGVLDAGAHELIVTSQMWARGWPGIIDLWVAFASGLAAAYANTRPGLFAALPGVAIAAALVPPIATSGLACAAGEFHLAYGSFLLFVSNMVAIVLAASLSLWAVGVRTTQDKGWLRHLSYGFMAVLLLLAVHLAQRTRPGPVALTSNVPAAIRAELPAGLRLEDVAARRVDGQLKVTVGVSGEVPPQHAVTEQLSATVSKLLQENVELRMTFVWQSVATGKQR